MTGKTIMNSGKCLVILDFQHKALNGLMHPLTCREHSDTMLIPTIAGENVVLRCPRYKECKYSQILTPHLYKVIEDFSVGRTYSDKEIEEMFGKEFLKNLEKSRKKNE